MLPFPGSRTASLNGEGSANEDSAEGRQAYTSRVNPDKLIKNF